MTASPHLRTYSNEYMNILAGATHERREVREIIVLPWRQGSPGWRVVFYPPTGFVVFSVTSWQRRIHERRKIRKLLRGYATRTRSCREGHILELLRGLGVPLQAPYAAHSCLAPSYQAAEPLS